jgi:hypothetical protein
MQSHPHPTPTDTKFRIQPKFSTSFFCSTLTQLTSHHHTMFTNQQAILPSAYLSPARPAGTARETTELHIFMFHMCHNNSAPSFHSSFVSLPGINTISALFETMTSYDRSLDHKFVIQYLLDNTEFPTLASESKPL